MNKKEMFINAQRDEVRIAIVADGALSELYVERASSVSYVSNIYKARVTNVEPSIQAAFVDFGKAKNGFLHISDLHPSYFPKGQKGSEAVGHKRSRRDRPPIQTCLRRGDEVIVQVTKEGIGTKGATLTTYLSIPGRYLVLMPGMHRLGVSRKIEDEAARQRLRTVLEELKPPPELGFIVRTAGMDRPKQELQRDLHYLLRLWKTVEHRSAQSKAPAELYQESDLVIRTIRDVYNADIQRIVCDDRAVACKVKEFLHLTMPRSPHRVDLYDGEVGIFHAFGLEEEIDRINSPRVPLLSGGSLVIDQTEALVAIDVNSGRFRQTDNAEATALRINSEAAPEVARQLRLRDLGGVIVIDFIDMIDDKHRRQVERILRDAVAMDRARTKLLRMSRFGIMEMTRQRVRPSLTSSIFRPCPHCAGSGRVKSDESQALAVMRLLSLAAGDQRVARAELTVPPTVAEHVLNLRRDQLGRLEQGGAKRILVRADAAMPGNEFRIACFDARGAVLQWDAATALSSHSKSVPTREITDVDMESTLTRTVMDEDVGNPVLGAIPQAAPGQAVEEEADEESFHHAEMEMAEAPVVTPEVQPAEPLTGQPSAQAPKPDQPVKKRRRRGGRRHRRKKVLPPTQGQQPGQPTQTDAPAASPATPPAPSTSPAPIQPKLVQPLSAGDVAAPVAESAPPPTQPGQQKSGRRRRRPRCRRKSGNAAQQQPSQSGESPAPPSQPELG